jgi:hypothetical protein
MNYNLDDSNMEEENINLIHFDDNVEDEQTAIKIR